MYAPLFHAHNRITETPHGKKITYNLFNTYFNFSILLFQLNNIYNHIKVVQIIINNTFINKQYLKIRLHKLTIDNVIKKIQINNITTYAIANTNEIIEKINKIKNHDVIYEIINIKKEMYISTALYYQVSD